MTVQFGKKDISYCPFCGSDRVSHLGNGYFFCGSKEPSEDLNRIVSGNGKRCAKVFAVIRLHGRNKNLIGNFTANNRREFNKIQQELYERENIKVPGKGKYLRAKSDA